MRIRCVLFVSVAWSLFFTNTGSASFLRQHHQSMLWFSPHERLMTKLQYSPGSICDITKITIGAYQSRLFQVRELEQIQLTGALPFSFGNFGVSFMQFGDKMYLEQTYTGLFGTEVTSEFQAAIAVRYYNLSIPNYGTASTIGVDLGGSWDVTSDLKWELAYSNINQTAIGRDSELLPQQIYSSLEYKPSDKLKGQTYLVHEMGQEIRYGAGSAIRPFPWISFAVDFITAPVRGSYGVIFQWKHFHITYVAMSHPVLPFTHRLGILFTL